jgi:hypothetical protein
LVEQLAPSTLTQSPTPSGQTLSLEQLADPQHTPATQESPGPQAPVVLQSLPLPGSGTHVVPLHA